jgi:tryptophanyl-tRNA synthetase
MMNEEKMKRHKRVFSGAQPSGRIHIGNYLGALRRWAAQQADQDNYFCVVDLHAITTPQDPEALRTSVWDTAALYIASGLDPDISTIFIQSHVSAHSELCWILNCVTPIGWLGRMTQYKTKAAQQESVSTGLLDYPVLQAADILLYDADEVPIGEDQKQHVELARDIAQRFNHLYGDTFTIPVPVISDKGARILALNDPTRKMSKSEAHIPGHAVALLDEPDQIRATIRTAVTDSGREIVFSEAPEKAGVNNLLEIFELFTGKSRPVIEAHFAGKGYGNLKTEVAEVVVESLRPIREQYRLLVSDPAELNRIMRKGADKARAVAEPKLKIVKQKLGLA